MITLLKNANLLVNRNGEWNTECHDIFIENGKVLSFECDSVPNACVNLGEQLLLPLFFNIHCHLGETLYKIEGDNWTISKYLKYTSNIVNNMTEEENNLMWNYSAQKTIKEMIKNGIGVFCAARSAELAKEYNICTMSGYPLMISKKLQRYYLEGFSGFSRYVNNNYSKCCSVGIFLHSLYKADEKLLRLAEKCFSYKADFITVHISEDLETRNLEIEKFQQEPVLVLDKYKLLTDKTILVHGGFLSKKELELVRKRNVMIAVCPISNHFLNTSCVDVYTLEKMGIRWCLATDGLATGRTFSIIEQAIELKSQFPKISNIKVLQSVSTIPAQVFNRRIYTGMIEKGVKAAFILVNNNSNNIENVLEGLFTGNVSWEVMNFE